MFVQVFRLGREVSARKRQTDTAFTIGTVTQGTGTGVSLLAFFHGLIETGERGQIRTGSGFLFLFSNPGLELVLSDHFYSDGHEGVVLATQFRTLTVVSALFTFRHQRPHFIDETGDSVFLAAEIRDPERVDHVVRGHQEANFLA